jgi:zinc protease
MVGDADPAAMVELIQARFGGWRADSTAPQEAEFRHAGRSASRVATVVYPGAPATATVGWVRPFVQRPPTRAVERQELEEALAGRILNRRLERHARGESAFISAQVGTGRHRASGEMTQLGVSARDGRWREALQEAFAIISDALRAPPSAAEIERELSNMRTAARAGLEGEATTLSPAWANQLANVIDSRDVVASAATRLALFEEFAPQISPDRVAAAMRSLFTGSPPRLLLLSGEPVQGGEQALAQALAAAEQAAPATRGEDRLVSFDTLPPLGPPGREVSRERIEDLDVTIVRFANGSTLTFKPTQYEQGRVLVRLRFGSGLAGMDPARPGLGWAAGVVAPSGVAISTLKASNGCSPGAASA